MSYLTSAQVSAMSTSELVLHFGQSFTINVQRSSHNDTPCIVFRSISRGLVSALGTHHARKLQSMQTTWTPWTSGARADKSTDGYYYNVVALKGLRPSTLKAWIAAAKSGGFVVDVASNVFWSQRVTNELNATTVVAEAPVEVVVVDYTPDEARVVYQINGVTYPALNPIQARIKSLTVKEMKEYLKSVGCKTTGNKAVLRDRVMATI